MPHTRSHALFEAARRVIPGGVNSPVRAFGAVGGEPLFMAHASGATITDVDGNTYVDFVGSWGPLILGHAHPEVVSAVQEAAARGTSFGAPTSAETDLARLIVERVPSVEMVRFVNSGTEATMSAVRLARGATGRDKLVKFEGCYHGHGDSFLIKAGSGALTTGTPSSGGVPGAIAGETLVARFNDLPSVEALFEAHRDDIAAVIVEPVAGNMGVIAGEPTFLNGLRDLCHAHGALLIFDEVMTGFRVHPQGAQGLYAIQPDLTTFGKVIGGGLPVGAYGGRRELMEQVAPLGPVYQAGTLSGNPLAMAAGLATLQHCDEALYARLEDLGHALESGLRDAATRHGGVTVNRVGSMFTLFFTESPVTTYADVLRCDLPAFGRCFHLALEHGVYLPPSQFEAAFISSTHTPADVGRLVSVVEDFLQAA
ncbi:MAG: glutamate-1-semialdehyde 2,1-aminomutase [Candidatus Neomarinimicrobiota bacterium]